MAQTKTDIKAILSAAGIRPLKRFGQHFLIDGNLMRKLVAAAEVTPHDVVLEVGPGTGALTELLLAAAGHVVAVEIDRGLHAICESRVGTSPDLTLVHGDVLARKSRVEEQVLEILAERQSKLGGRIMLVANLPYQVATPLVVDLLLGELPVSPMCFTVQAEVADRLSASPGSKAYGPVSVFVQVLARPERIARVPPTAFWPEPKVESAMLRLDLKIERPPSPVLDRLSEVVHGCFCHRRKTMGWSLRKLLTEAEYQGVQVDGRWNLGDRPERITVAQWVELAETLAGRTDGATHR
jgi:16S rRNA (adenine1518-N6/adenine1519-N6)-dimethyltransferase